MNVVANSQNERKLGVVVFTLAFLDLILSNLGWNSWKKGSSLSIVN